MCDLVGAVLLSAVAMVAPNADAGSRFNELCRRPMQTREADAAAHRDGGARLSVRTAAEAWVGWDVTGDRLSVRCLGITCIWR